VKKWEREPEETSVGIVKPVQISEVVPETKKIQKNLCSLGQILREETCSAINSEIRISTRYEI